MLHRGKYNRFRNESVTSVDELLHGLSMNAKVSAVPPSLPVGDPPYAPPAEVLPPDPAEESGTLCTLINKVSNLKFANSSGLLGIKGLPSAVKDLAVSKLQGGASGGGSGSPGSSTLPAASGVPHAPPEHSSANSGKKGRMEESQPSGEGWGLGGTGGLVNKPSRGWLHSGEKISGPGVTYVVKYLGCIEVLRSMRSLDFTTRSQITREAISLVCEAVPGAKGALRKRKPPSKLLSSILGKSNLQFAGMSINLNISTSSLNLMTPDSKQIIANHHMQSISFASGGDPDTTDYVAYVAKDPVNRRACHILECSDGLAQDVISTIGQAFDLRFQLYLQCPSSKPSSMHDRVMSTDEPPWTEEGEESADHHYYNSIPGKMPPPGGFIDARLTNQTQDSSQAAGVHQTYYQGRPMFIQQGSCDIYSLPEVKGQAPKPGEVPTYVNTQHIDTQMLAALQGESETPSDSGTSGTAKDSPRKDLFDMKPFEDAIMTQTPAPAPPASELHKAASVDNCSPLLMRAAALRAQEELEDQTWYHGEMSRRQAEKLLLRDGDFLVRKSSTNPGSYVLTGMHHGLAKHLLLVDPEGTVRTKDHIFESISHLIGHHRDNNLPIVSAGSELCLKQPVERKQ
ncbi:SHC-transforming protein 3-like [Sinocyclocheilus grahami]|uniref:SHC adaptor protein 3 n=1 Tax=Sinocyclocheilus grahami TaxID=75366 RepID=A0A672NSB1_SINGR|nr:PREDICTED: SHC-transforming protein 3-like [Sinocyclocheilus grahami]XP_016146446.1 PREDICTED: SHC-transforming protein 3-like [Sinocyclocheilus grahami]XP_016146447.1 PREDICTED: SHC-transforming protein 3-like [Sinocyclocheilus grahami]